MNGNQKNRIRNAANAFLNKGYVGRTLDVGANTYVSDFSTSDRHGRKYASTILAERAGFEPTSQRVAQKLVAQTYGLSPIQAAKLDRVAASTHNLGQRAYRVSRFLTRVVQNPDYLGFERPTSNAAGI